MDASTKDNSFFWFSSWYLLSAAAGKVLELRTHDNIQLEKENGVFKAHKMRWSSKKAYILVIVGDDTSQPKTSSATQSEESNSTSPTESSDPPPPSNPEDEQEQDGRDPERQQGF